MDEFLKGECSHCGQPIEFPSEGAGQTVPCPTCKLPLVLTPVNHPAPKAAALTPLDRAFSEFQADRQFAGRSPTREQVARAWALARFRKAGDPGHPFHVELVPTLKELF